MRIWTRIFLGTAVLATVLLTTGCGTVSTLGKLEDGAGGEAGRMWDRWVDGNGDIAVATTWERKVKPGVTDPTDARAKIVTLTPSGATCAMWACCHCPRNLRPVRERRKSC